MSKVMDTILARGITTIPKVTDEDIDLLQQRYDSMLGVESVAKEKLGLQIEKLRAAKLLSGTSVLDTRALRWRWPKVLRCWDTPRSAFFGIPIPRLALLRIDDPTVRLAVSSSRGSLNIRTRDSSKLFPKVWADNLKDVELALQQTYTWSTVSICFEWSGAIPDDARTQILEAQNNFGPDDVFLLTEAPADKWKLDSPPRPAFVDPLIIGHRGGLLFYLGKFDPTKIEDYVSLEFTS